LHKRQYSSAATSFPQVHTVNCAMAILQQLQYPEMRFKHIAVEAMIAAALLCMLGAWPIQAEPRPRCLSYEPAVVSLHGTLSRKTFPGPPNYESNRKGDKPETAWFLDLRAPICVGEDKLEPDLNQAQDGVRKVQLILKSGQYQRYKGLIGRKLLAKGTLSQEITAHHHAPLLLTVRTLEELQR
jgi:hypothetical protein